MDFSNTFGGFVYGAALLGVMLSFFVLDNRYPRLSAASLLLLAAGCLFAAYWHLIRSNAHGLEQLLTIPIGWLHLVAAPILVVWGCRKFRAVEPGMPQRKVATAPREERLRLTIPGERVPLPVWAVAFVVGAAFTAMLIYQPFVDGVWRHRKGSCLIPQDLGCTLFLVGLGLGVGLVAAVAVIFLATRLWWLLRRITRGY